MYTPSWSTLRKYADVMVNFALHGGKGVKKGEVVYLGTPQAGLPLAREIYKTILAAGAHPLLRVGDDACRLAFLQDASDAQLSFYPEKYWKGLAGTVDHLIHVLAEEDPLLLKSCDPKNIFRASNSAKPFRDMLDKKEDRGDFSWTLCLYGTPGMAREAGLSERQYWQQIVKACFLREEDPVAKWKQVAKDIKTICGKLNRMPISRVHVEAENTDLWITVGAKRQWLGGGGRNIPSFEIFTSPDWRGTEGKISFSEPLYLHGSLIRGISLEFRNGKVVKASAKKNQKLLLEMIKQKNADKVGEFSLTDRRFSKIEKFMASTLYDENVGGRHGNCHIALGSHYSATYSGDAARTTRKTFEKLGFNDSPVHTDIVTTTDRVVTAELENGKTRLIYEKGQFAL
jgi:aminopeptidase